MAEMNGNMKYFIGAIGLLITLGTIVFTAGGIRADIKTNATQIESHYKQGCEPSVQVRQEIAAMKAQRTGLEKKVDEMTVKIDKMYDLLLAR